jgi:hypothetical protein
MTDKTFSIAGVSRLKGEFKARFANDMSRVKTLIKTGHTDIDLIELKEPMTKRDAVAFLLSIDFATRDGKTNDEVQGALLAEVDKRQDKPVRAPKAEKAPRPAKAPKAVKAKPTLESIAAKAPAKKAAPKSTVTRKEIEAQMADMEDAPF